MTKQLNLSRYLSLPSVYGVGASILVFLVYLKTLAPTVSFIDSGELAAVCHTLGVAHPTGYPLFTLLGWLFSRIPTAAEEIVRLNLMAAFFNAAGVFVFFHVMYLILSLIAQRSSLFRTKDTEALKVGLLAASTGGALLLGFSETYWSQAVSIEVYSLHVLFLSLNLLTFLRATFAKEVHLSSDEDDSRRWYVFAFVLGLSFTNHMTTILLAPGLIYLYFSTQGGGPTSWKRIGRMAVPFLIGLSVYFYLPIRASQSPTLNWGNTVSLERFLWHVTGKQYRVWITWFTESAGRQFNHFLDSLPAEFAYAGLALAVPGLWLLWKSQRRLFYASAILFVTCVMYAINYDIHDIDSYFLLAYVVLALWAGAGLLFAYTWILTRIGLRKVASVFLIAAVGIIPAFFHYSRNDESNNYLVEDYTANMFASLQPNALVLSFQWDYWLAASYYYQLVKGVRTDVAVVDKELLRRSWYLKELEERYPWLIRASRMEVDAFEKELFKFEHELPYNPAVIQARFVEMITSFIRKSMSDRPVYVTHEIEPEFTTHLQRVPEGLAFRLYADTLVHRNVMPLYSYRPFERSGRLEDMIRVLYANSYISRAKYLVARSMAGHEEEIRKCLVTALEFHPGSNEARQLLRVMSPGAQ
jgi:hypothetical protein